MSKPFLYAIMQPDGTPWWDESCVCEDREPLEEIVEQLNDYSMGGEYKVVPLYLRRKKK